MAAYKIPAPSLVLASVLVVIARNVLLMDEYSYAFLPGAKSGARQWTLDTAIFYLTFTPSACYPARNNQPRGQTADGPE